MTDMRLSDSSDVMSNKILELMDLRYLAAQSQNWEVFDRLTRAIDDEKKAAKMLFCVEMETTGGEPCP